ncbi:MAG: glycosyltransferase family 4 protein [Candidatus Brocadiales bacterium]|nr:glycosyltransferase family 4 protein [Candidatus Bathyanammoxibius sp.]
MRITYYHRRLKAGYDSIERLFRQVRLALPGGVVAAVAVPKFISKGLVRRLYNILEAPFRQGDVNHITGDVHYLAYFLRKRKTILTIHDCGNLLRLKGMKRSLFTFFWYRLPMARSAKVTVVSRSTRQQLVKHLRCDEDTIEIVPNCIPDGFQVSPYTFNSVQPRILQVGTGQHKNLVMVAQALAGIPCHLRIIGELSAEQTEALSAYGIDYSSAANLGDDEVDAEYRACDMLVFASTHEGFGLPILEAQATGRPLVTSNLMSMPEVAGKGAILVDPYDPVSVRDGIKEVITSASTRERLIADGLENIQRFAPEIIVDRYLRLYEQMIGKVQ